MLPVHGGSGEFGLVLAKLGWEMFSLVKVKHLQTEGKSERGTGEGFQQDGAHSLCPGHCPALSDPHVLCSGGLHKKWGHLKFLCGMAEKQLGCSQGDPAWDVGADRGEEHPCISPGRGASAPGCTPVVSRQTLFHLLMLGVSSGCVKAASEGPASWEPLLRVLSDSCDLCGWQKNRSERKRNGKESVAIFNHK